MKKTRTQITQDAHIELDKWLGFMESNGIHIHRGNTDSILVIDEVHRRVEDTTYEVVEDKQLTEGQPDSSS